MLRNACSAAHRPLVLKSRSKASKADENASMKIAGTHYRTIWPLFAQGGEPGSTAKVRVIDQTRLPFTFATLDLTSGDDAAAAIRTMVVRGAPLIGATAAFGL